MDNQIQIFNNPQFGEIRTLANEANEPLFCAADVCKALGYANGRDAIAKHVDEGDVAKRDAWVTTGTKADGTPAKRQTEMAFVNESGLYSLIFGSKLESAKSFKRWVTSEVLPTIRKSGGYMVSKADDTPEEIMARAVVIAQETIARQKRRIEEQTAILEQKERAIGRLKPKADFADYVFTSDTLVSIGQAAKILKLPFGRNTLFKKLREKGILFRNSNEPKQRYVDAKYFNLVEGQPIPRSDGSLFIPLTVYCTQKGLAYINHLFGNNRANPQLPRVS